MASTGRGGQYTQISVNRSRATTDSVAVITLQRPRALNAITKTMLTELVTALSRLAEEKVRVVILTGSGRAFSAGVDLNDAQEIFQGSSDSNEMESPLLALENYPGVTIGAINGFAFTGGFELALGCDILIAAETAQFADTHCKFGIHPSWGLSQKLPRIIGPGRARVMSFTAKPIDAATAERWGLVTAVTKPELLMQKAFKLANAITRNHPRLVLKYKELSRDGWQMPLGEARKMEVRSAIDYAASMTVEDFMEMQRFIAQRRAQSKAAKAAAAGGDADASSGGVDAAAGSGRGGNAKARKRVPVGMGRAGGGPRSKL